MLVDSLEVQEEVFEELKKWLHISRYIIAGG
jgi:hypothetical protein